MTIYKYEPWKPEHLEGKSEVYLGHLHENIDGNLRMIPYTLHSDYSGGTVECANCKYLDENYKPLRSKAIWRVYGGYDTEGYIMLRNPQDFQPDNFELSILWDQLREEIASLHDYPLFNDEVLSELELELEESSWNDWVKYDLEKALIEKGIYNDDTMPSSDELCKLFHQCAEKANVYFECESHNSGYWDIDRIVKKWSKNET